MIGTVAVIAGKPGTGDTLEAALRDLATGTHSEEGCVLYSLQRGVAEPDTFVTVEKWRSQADLDAHMQTPHIAAALGIATDLLARDILIIPTQILDVGEKGTF